MLEQVTLFPVPTFLLANVPVAVAVGISLLTAPASDTVHVAVVPPLYSLLLAETLGVNDTLLTVNLP